jgi:hypothetical protein
MLKSTQTTQTKLKIRKDNIEWSRVKELDNQFDNLKEFLKQQNTTCIKTYTISKNKVAIGKSLFYKCKDDTCPLKYKITKTDGVNVCEVHRYEVHNHELEPKKDYINNKQKVKEICRDVKGVKPKEIYQKLVNEDPNEEEIVFSDRKKILQKIRAIKHNTTKEDSNFNNTIVIEEINKYLEMHLLNPQLIKDVNKDFFVSRYRLGTGTDNDPFQIVFSSKFMINYLKKQQTNNNNIGIIGLDGTYKISNLNYPLLVLTVPDIAHHTYPVAFSLSSSESQDAYSYFLEGVNDAFKTIFNTDYTPSYIVSDCSNAIISSCLDTYKDVINIACYFHIKKNIKENFNKHEITKDKRASLLDDIDSLRMIHSGDIFQKAYSLFKTKYKDYKSFLEYFEKTYIKFNFSNWPFY